ncbi:MAG: hypothetical protein A2V98_24440 [Planctomycetes bacterium RBG_16_64_12]|nr:MAG: hypothetical protein A2V98_24440 [Planctomycetes bacterium RBG_16_64_12]
MRYVLSLVAVFVCLLAAPVFAADGNVSQPTLDILGLSGMQTLSDEDGMQVRGMSSAAWTQGLSLVSGLLVDPATKSYVLGADVNRADASAENAGFQVLSQASHAQSSSLSISLEVTTSTSSFIGMIIGGAGGSGSAAAQ